MEFISYMRDFNIVTVLSRIFLACLAGGVLGAERGKHRESSLKEHRSREREARSSKGHT